MSDLTFLALLGLLLFTFLVWGFKALPHERWQMLATVPLDKVGGNHWRGLNLTFYGFFSATGYTLAAAMLFLLLGTIHTPPLMTSLLVVITLAVCVPASSRVARMIEKKPHTFSVAAGFFVGVIVVPPTIHTINIFSPHQIQVLPTLAAAVIAYAFGEALGRLACISFGCCYGKPVADLSPWARTLFGRWHFIFAGETKKIAYASGMAGVKVIPIQALTAIIYTLCGLGGVYLFLQAQFAIALVLVMTITQGWRLYSETLRADHRGGGRVSAYQVMTMVATLYAFALGWWLADTPRPPVELAAGLAVLWHAGMLIALQMLWLIIFIFTGRSAVTEATVTYRVCHDKI